MISRLFRAIATREAGRVKRCHTWTYVGSYTVAEHSFHMLTLLEALHPNPPLGLYRAIIRHDLPERYIGDTPFPAKCVYPGLRQNLVTGEKIVAGKMGISRVDLREQERAWLKALDAIEFWMFLHDQKALGVDVAQKIEEMGRVLEATKSSFPAECQKFLKHYQWKMTDDLRVLTGKPPTWRQRLRDSIARSVQKTAERWTPTYREC